MRSCAITLQTLPCRTQSVTGCAGSEPPAGYRGAREAGEAALPLPVQAEKLRTPRVGPLHLLYSSLVWLCQLHSSQAPREAGSQGLAVSTDLYVLSERFWSASCDEFDGWDDAHLCGSMKAAEHAEHTPLQALWSSTHADSIFHNTRLHGRK